MEERSMLLVVIKYHHQFLNFVTRCKKIKVTHDLHILSGVDENGFLNFLELNGTCASLPDISVKCHYWQEDFIPNKHNLLVVDDSGYWNLYQAVLSEKDFVIQKQSFWNTCDIGLQLEKTESEWETEILKFCGNEVIFAVCNSDLIRMSLCQDLPPECKLSVKISDGEAKCLRYLAEKVYTLHEEFICAYDMRDGAKCFQWNLRIANPNCFWISPGSETVLVANNSDKLFVFKQCTSSVKLKSHFYRKPVISAFVKQLKDRRQAVPEKAPVNHVDLEGALLLNVIMCSNHAIYLVAYELHNELRVVGLDSGKILSVKRLAKSSELIASPDFSLLPLIISESQVLILLLDSSPNRLVNELMVYTGGTVLHNLALLNKWQCITVDLEVFEIGMRNRQLSTISFFLNGKLEEFRAFWTRLCDEEMSVEVIQSYMEKFMMVLELLSRFLQNHFVETTTSLHFAEQLLRLALETVVTLVTIVTIDFPSPRYFPVESVAHPGNLFTHHLVEMRRYLVSYPLEAVDVPEMNFGNSRVKRWDSESFSVDNVIQDAIIYGCIPLAQWYLSVHDNKVSVDDIKHVGLQFAENIVSAGKFDDARMILRNLDLDFTSELLKMMRTTTKRKLRQLLLGEFSGCLSSEEHEAIKFLDCVEELYPCSDFELALQDKSRTQDMLLVGDITLVEQKCFKYCSLSLELVNSWDAVSRKIALVPLLINGKYFGNDLPGSVVWNYLLQHGDLDNLLQWVHCFYEKQQGSGFPYGWSITLSMVNSVKGHTVWHVEDALLDEIAKYGIICEDELEDISLLLRRLGRAGCSLGSSFVRQDSSLAMVDFNHRIVHYCLEHNLLRFLYYFLSLSGRYLHTSPCPICHVPVLMSILSFCHWLNKPDDESLFLEAIILNGHRSYMLPKPTLTEMCSHAPVVMAASTCLFSDDVPENMAVVLHQNPLLHSAFFPSVQTSVDVTMYHLLHGHAPFDPSRLFGWQTTNTLKTEDSLSVLPHFSLPLLVQKYGLHQELDFIYYLMEGRPNFAYLKFVSQELLNTGALSTRRINDACLEASLIGISNFNIPKVTASCILFIELLNQSSLSLRIDLQVALFLHAKQLLTSSDLVFQLQSCQESPHYAQKVATLMASVLSQKKINSSTEMLRVEDLRLYFLLVNFCHLHCIEVEISFLKIYAKANDWLAFFVLAQIFQIPRDMLLGIVPDFLSECLIEHITHFLQMRHAKGRLEVKTDVNKDLRSFLYTKIGVRKELKASNSSPSLSLEAQSDDDRISLSSEDGFPSLTDDDDGKDNLLEMLLYAFKVENPGDFLLRASCSNKNPILALVANSFTNATVVSSMCSWIIATLADDSSPCNGSWTQKDLERLACDLVAQNHYNHLRHVFLLFVPESFLCQVCEFLHIFWIEKRYQASFAVLYEIKKEKMLLEELWIQELAGKLLVAALSSSCVVTYEAKIFVKHLTSADDLITTEMCNFKKLRELLDCLGDSNIDLPVKDLLQPSGSDSFVDGAWKVVHALQQTQMFRSASLFGQCAQLSRDQVLLSQLNVEAAEMSTEDSRYTFWEHCNDIMNKENISAKSASLFFQDWCKKVDRYEEKCLLMHLSFCWLRDSHCELEMWLYCIKAEMQLNNAVYLLDTMKDDFSSNWEFSSDSSFWDLPNVSLTNPEESLALNRLLDSLLDKGHFGQALRLVAIFDHQSVDMDIISTCLKLARHQKDFSDVPRELYGERKITSSAVENESDAVLNVMNGLYDLLVHGKPVCNKIIVHYSIAQFLGWTYEQVAKHQDTLPLLEEVLTSAHSDKYDLAKKLIAVRSVNNRDVVFFLSKKICQSLREMLGIITLQSSVDVQDFGFRLLLGLCEDPSVLGTTLLNEVEAGENTNEKELALVVELYIRAHDCFTASANTEGIARVLRKARSLTLQLTASQNFNLLVRLLTGVGRYSEMTYIFDILHENSAFELLLKRGMEKLPLLRLALLNYLKHQHASNTEIHSMLALKFGMFREVAEILESSSSQKLRVLKKDCGKPALEIVAQDLEAAAKSYRQAGCFRRAVSCARRANLILLQITLLPSGTWILGLEGEAVKNFIVERKIFFEAYVVAEAYQEYQTWDKALYVNVVQRTNWEYLRDFRTHLGLSTAMIESVAKRFHSDNASTHAQNMKQLLNFCVDMEAKYRIARQIGFDDVVQDLLQGDAGAYLQDLAAKRLV